MKLHRIIFELDLSVDRDRQVNKFNNSVQPHIKLVQNLKPKT